MGYEEVVIDCPKCGGKKTLTIERWFESREAMDDFGIYSWQQECCECGYEDSHYE